MNYTSGPWLSPQFRLLFRVIEGDANSSHLHRNQRYTVSSQRDSFGMLTTEEPANTRIISLRNTTIYIQLVSEALSKQLN